MSEEAKDAAMESVFAEREQLQRRSAALDRIEAMIEALPGDDLDVILEMSNVFIRAAQLRAQKLNRTRLRPARP